MNLKIKHFTEISEGGFNDLAALERAIFEYPMSKEDFRDELSARKNLSLAIAFDAETPCGYKLGYEYSREIFFSLSGGVVPLYRRKGIATALMLRQHEELKKMGYSFVRTHTKNKYKDMLILNIKNGFEVTGVYKSLREKLPGIILEKELKA